MRRFAVIFLSGLLATLALLSLYGRTDSRTAVAVIASGLAIPSAVLALAIALALALVLRGKRQPLIRIALLSAIVLLVAWSPLADSFGAGQIPGDGRRADHRNATVIVSANMFRANRTPRAAVQAVLDQNADIVMMQEANGPTRPFLNMMARHYKYRTPCLRYCSLIIWSRRPLSLLPDSFSLHLPWQFRRMMLVARTQDRTGQTVVVATVHYPQPVPVAKQAAVRTALAEALARTDGARLILAGDMNMAGWSPTMAQQDHLFHPLVRATHGLMTYPALIAMKDLPWPLPFVSIDHLYSGAGFSAVWADSFAIPGSDHRGIRVLLQARP
ncbi:endonuclease/exonuclease/phosphatase family protein [Sphingobium algorifonticola]|nr:endonuclease/exonuclease/phosphatase family protein [Sphingobium algorifonticola]